MATKVKPVRNNYVSTSPATYGYTVTRYICENAPTNQVRPKQLLDGHHYYSASIGNGAGWRWFDSLRTKTCQKCGGRMIPIDTWQPKEA